MKKIVFITTSFNRIDKIQWPPYVKDWLDNPDISSIHSESNSRVYFKRFNTEAYCRLALLQEIDENGNELYIPRLYFRNHKKYDEFRELSNEEQIKKCKYDSSEQEEIENKIAELAEKEKKPILPLSMRDIESQRDFSNTATSYVFEMEDWDSHIMSKEMSSYLSKIYDTLQEVVINKQHESADGKGWITVPFGKGGEMVLRIIESDKHTYYYLFDVAEKVDKNALDNKYCNCESSELLKKAKKGYPDWILYGDFKEWEKLELDEDANLALSDEEVQVLNNIPYPYFINGLAGSGKSTILYYLFAHAFSHQSDNRLRLLFLSYSKDLVKKAMNVVSALLKSNPSYGSYKFTDDEAKRLEKSFSPFQDFLKANFLDTEEELARFDDVKRIDFNAFQDLYQKCQLPESNSYSATIVWSVIRSFIKGRDYKTYFSKEDYRNLQKDDMTVKVEDFAAIHKIWNNWYHHFEEERWDDIDLVRYILQKLDSDATMNYNKYDIIYCDEAQDFTPIENQLILRLSTYSDFDLKDFRKIPIAYAGDPNQTVSPTGFSWTRLKDVFNNTFVEKIGKFISLKDQTLNNNYRSKRNIVAFANSIQYIRKCFLSSDPLQPQEQWNPQANPVPGYFLLDTEENIQLIQQALDEVGYVITGAEGEYEVRDGLLTPSSTPIEDELLKNMKQKNHLYTATTVKGLEGKVVLLYRFADYLPESFSCIEKGENITNESDKYDLSHFFTKLYIAVSRAKELLYIVDTKDNYERFWKHFDNNQLVANLMKTRKDGYNWEKLVGGIEPGNRELFIKRIRDNFDPIEVATKAYANAKLSEDPKEMRRAADYFEEGGRNHDAMICRAYALMFEKEYMQSGKMFESLGMTSEAAQAYWKGACFNQLLECSDKSEYKLAARFMCGEERLLKLLKHEGFVDRIKRDDTWNKVVLQISKEAVNIDRDDIPMVCDFLNTLSEQGYSFLNQRIAELYFINKKYKEAIRVWDAEGNTNHKNYYQAQVRIADSSSDAVFWMDKGGETTEILKQYGDPDFAKTVGLDERARGIIFKLLLNSGKFDKAYEYPYEKEDRLNRLYFCNKAKFIQRYVLTDFTQEKFFEWIEDKVSKGYVELFEEPLPKQVLDGIFNLKEDWLLFMKLRDNNDNRVMKYKEQLGVVTDAVDNALATRNFYFPLVSCFLDVLFNDSDYSYVHANKYESVMNKIALAKNFSKKDFRANEKFNHYFTQSGITSRELDTIKDNLRDYIVKKIQNNKKVKSTDMATIEGLCLLFEKVVAFVPESAGSTKYVPDYDSVLTFYEVLQKNKSYAFMKEFFAFRPLVIEMYKSSSKTFKFLLTGLQKANVSCSRFLQSLDREDSIFISSKLLSGKHSKESLDEIPKIQEWILGIASLVYENDLKLKEFDMNKRERIINMVDFLTGYAIERMKDESRIDLYAIKTLTYMWEVFLDHKTTAQRYDEIQAIPRFKKVPHLAEYFQIRALHYFYHSSEKSFELKQKQYGIFKDVAEHHRPIISHDDYAKSEPKPIRVNDDTCIDGITVELKASKKIIWFTKDGVDLATVSKGQITIDDSHIKQIGNTFDLNSNFKVIVASESLCSIIVGEKTYEIVF